MVQALTLAVAAFAAVATVTAAPTHHRAHAHTHAHPSHEVAQEARAIDLADSELLDARNPFSFKKAFRKIGRVASRVGGVALKAAPLLLRDVESELDARSVVEDGPLGQIYIRDEDGVLYVRELDAEELSAALEAREPRFNLKRTLRKGLGAVRKGVAIADKVSGIASQFGLREMDEMELEEREFKEGLLDELD